MATFPSVDDQMSILMRGVNFGDELTYQHMAQALRTRLEESCATGRPLRVYCGRNKKIGNYPGIRRLELKFRLIAQVS